MILLGVFPTCLLCFCRGSSESEPEAAAAPSKRGPKTSATTVPKSVVPPSTAQRKNGPKPAARPQQAATQKPSSKTVQQKGTNNSVPQKKSAQTKKSVGRKIFLILISF